MTNFKNIIATASAAVLMFSGSAFAATAFAAPAAGQAPYFSGVVSTSSPLQRADVEAQAAAKLPAAGEFSEQAASSHAASDLSRTAVESSIDVMPAAGENV